MANVDLSEIRALLKAQAEADRRPARRPLLEPLRTLIRPPRQEPVPPPEDPGAPRRVGLTPRPEVEAAAEEVLLLDDPLKAAPPLTLRRQAFGLRSEDGAAPAPALALPPPGPAFDDWADTLFEPVRRDRPQLEGAAALLDEADVGEAMRRLGSRLARTAAEEATPETPYMPEDLSDLETPGEDHFPDADLFEPAMAPAPAPEPAPQLRPANDAGTGAKVLSRLEQVLLTEQAALRAVTA